MTQPRLIFSEDVPVELTTEQPPANPVATERRRLTANALRVLEFLKMRGTQGAYNYELATPEVGGLRGVGRIWELRQDGWDIRKERIDGGTWRYTLHLPLTL